MALGRSPALGFIFVTVVLDVLGVGIIIPILPELVKELQGLGLGSASYTYGILIGLYSLMQFVFAPILGSLSDQFGRRPVILISLFGGALDYFLLAWAPTLAWLFIGRIISGISGANFSAASAYIADISPPEKRSANFGILGAAFGLGFIIGPFLGGKLGVIDPRLPFWVAGCLTLLNWFYGFFVLPESLKLKNRRPFSFARANPFGALGELKKHPLIKGLSLTYFLSSFAHQVYPATWVLYTSYRYGWTPEQTGNSLGLVGLMSAIVQGGLTRIVIPRIGERNAAIWGLGIMLLAMIGYAFATEPWMIYAMIVFGSLSGVATPALQGVVSKTTADDQQGAIQGAFTSLQSITGIFGPPIMTGLFGYFISKNAPFMIPGAAFFFGALLILLAAIVASRTFRFYGGEEVIREKQG